MNAGTILFLVFLSSSPIKHLVDAFSLSNVNCRGSTFHDLRIRGCNQEPCMIRIGQPLTFQLDVSLKGATVTADVVNLEAFIPNYRNSSRTDLSRASCESGDLKCPITSDKIFTVKSSFLIHPTGKCENFCEVIAGEEDGTGLRQAHVEWRTSSNNGRSRCTFKVILNIVPCCMLHN